MTWLRVSACFLAVSLLLQPTLSAVCPKSCVCSTTRDGLHRATCSSLSELYKFTLQQRHHNINILDLSHNNITKLAHELDRLTEVVTLDLSTNGIQDLNKFLNNAKKLVHLNLANNRIQKLSLTHLPTSVSSLDLTNNLLQDVPSDIGHLIGLEHLELEGNPLNCSCENLIARDRLLIANVFIDNVKCVLPSTLSDRSWLELKTKDICKIPASINNYSDMMMGDQPYDAVQVGEETSALKSMPLVAKSDLEDGSVIHSENKAEEDDNLQYIKVGKYTTSSPISDIEGSGDTESTTIIDIMEIRHEPKLRSNLLASDEMIPVQNVETTTEFLIEGSGEGSGLGGLLLGNYDEDITEETTTVKIEELNPGPISRIFVDELEKAESEFPTPEPPSVYQGGSGWNSKSEEPPPVTTEKLTTSSTARDTTVSGKYHVTQASEVGLTPNNNDSPPHKTGTYVCIAIIVILLIGLIGFAVIKGQMRKRRDRRLLRQQKRDVEKASKEMVDMNKSLLGKPAAVESPIERKVNGNYELVPTHESHQKKSENGDVGKGIKQNGIDETRTDSPRDSNQNKSSSKDNNIADGTSPPQPETSFESAPASPDSRKDTNSLSSVEISVPLNDDEIPKINGIADFDISQPLINGDQNTDSDFLSPSREYVPVYSPDMGRVRIKMTETPKPKTPVLVTRSRSNAGDMIITPSGDANIPKSTT